MAKYCTIIKDEDTRIKFINIAEAMGIKVCSFTKYNSLNEEHIKKHNTNYYMVLRNDAPWIIDSIYTSTGKEVKNEIFIKLMYLYSLKK